MSYRQLVRYVEQKYQEGVKIKMKQSTINYIQKDYEGVWWQQFFRLKELFERILAVLTKLYN